MTFCSLKASIFLGVFFFAAVLVSWSAQPATTAEPAYSRVEMRENPTEAQVKSYLKSLRLAVTEEFESRIMSQNYVRVRLPNEKELRALDQKLAVIPISHLATICQVGVSPGSPLFTQLVADSLVARRDYRPEDKPVVLKYLVEIPKLVVVVERMDWFDVSDPAVLTAWRMTKRYVTPGILDQVGYRFAALAAGRGMKDALIALASTAKTRALQPSSASRDAMMKTDAAILADLVPANLESSAALAEHILKNRNALVFDPAQRIYVAKH